MSHTRPASSNHGIGPPKDTPRHLEALRYIVSEPIIVGEQLTHAWGEQVEILRIHLDVVSRLPVYNRRCIDIESHFDIDLAEAKDVGCPTRILRFLYLLPADKLWAGS